jgi:hypothetical protein
MVMNTMSQEKYSPEDKAMLEFAKEIARLALHAKKWHETKGMRPSQPPFLPHGIAVKLVKKLEWHKRNNEL